MQDRLIWLAGILCLISPRTMNSLSIQLVSKRIPRKLRPNPHQISDFSVFQASRLNGVRYQSNDNEKDDRVKLQTIEDELFHLNNNTAINANSPNQVSIAIFGRKQSTCKDELLRAVRGEAIHESGNLLSEDQRRLAELVLEYREIYRSQDTKQLEVTTTNICDYGGLKNDESGLSGFLKLGAAEDNVSTKQILQRIELEQPTKSSTKDVSEFDSLVDSLFDNSKCQIPDQWRDILKQVTRPTARALISQLDSTICPMGFNPTAATSDPLRSTAAMFSTDETNGVSTASNKGSFLEFCRDKARKHPDCILLVRCGDFFETYGVNGIMLVQHCGLNPMAGKAKAGFPFRSIQASLDCLVEKGFTIAVYEEATDTDALPGTGAKAGSKSRLKSRMLAQIVSPACPTYMYDLVLLGNTAESLASSLPARPYIGVLSMKSGYTVVEVSIEERSCRVSERLTAEAVAAVLAANPPAPPLLVVPSLSEYDPSVRQSNQKLAPYLPSASRMEQGVPQLSVRVIPPNLIPVNKPGTSDIEKARNLIVSSILQMTDWGQDEADERPDNSARRVCTVEDFKLIGSHCNQDHAMAGPRKTTTQPLHVESATQLGLMNDKTIPSLMSYILPSRSPAAARRFLRRYLLMPPPPHVCEAMAKLVSCLRFDGLPMPPGAVPPLGKVLSLIRSGQAGAVVYGEVLAALAATVMILELGTAGVLDGNPGERLIDPLRTVLEHESGMAAESSSLKRRCLDAMAAIEEVLSPIHHASVTTGSQRNLTSTLDPVSDFGILIPSGFCERNEVSWRARVRPNVAVDAYSKVDLAAKDLAEAVAKDFFGSSSRQLLTIGSEATKFKNPIIVQDVINNMFALKEIPAWVKSTDKTRYLHPRDRNGKILSNRWTTAAVQSALGEYVSACSEASKSVSNVLTKLSRDLEDNGHIPAIVQASHANLILFSAHEHARQANSLGWNHAEVYESEYLPSEESDSAGYFEGVWPYWMQNSEAVKNTFEMKDLFLLTAPNMSGKSTLMRSSAAAALLSVVGLCAPLSPGSRIRRFDQIFVRGASADVPTEHKSAFGAEMLDVAALLRCCGPKSLVFVDELGRGTSPRDGTRLAGAVLEAMAKAGMSGFFATHLHEILLLPLECSDRIVRKRMAIHENGFADDDREGCTWTYKLTDGICTDSMALVTAAQFGIPSDVLARAEELSSYLAFEEKASAPVKDDDVFAVDPGLANAMTGHPVTDTGMHSVVGFVREVSAQTPHTRIPPGWKPPASLEGRSCVYVLRLECPGDPVYYVGETDSMQQRLLQHRAKRGNWALADCIAFPVDGGKTEARALESLLIQKLAQAGLLLQSLYDGRRRRSFRNGFSAER